MSAPRRIGLTDLARGIARGAPEALRIPRGLFSLATLRPNSRRSIGRVIEHWAARTPTAPALRFEDREWSYARFNAWANRIAAAWAARGIGRGDTVALLMGNRPETLACVTAAVKLGAVAGLLNHQQRGEVLAHSLSQIDPALLVFGADCREALESIDPGVPLQCYDRGVGTQAALADTLDQWSDRNPRTTASVRAADPCFYIFTSGTSGLPKASVMTHYRWLAAMSGVGTATLRLRADDVFYVCLPLYHNNALTVSWSAVLSAGACMALDERFSASHFWDRVRRHRATAFCYIGELLRYLLNQVPRADDRHHDVRLIAGNGLRPEIWAEFEARFGIEQIYEFYGASESNIAFINAFGARQTAGFSPMPYAIVEFDAAREAPVRDARGFLRRVPRGGTGLLISKVSERQPFDGYTDPDASQARLLRHVFRHGDCWFDTGDLVRDQGFRHIQFVDRVGDSFRWKGENVSSSEVEGVLARQPGIAHAVVYGVPVPNTDGRAGMAAITVTEARAFDGAALAAALRAALPRYAVPVFLRIVPEAETTGTFKYRKGQLKREGFDPARVAGPLYRLAPNGYVPLGADEHAAIIAGKLRL